MKPPASSELAVGKGFFLRLLQESHLGEYMQTHSSSLVSVAPSQSWNFTSGNGTDVNF